MRIAVLVVLLAACGDDGVRHTPDATVHDGPVIDDAPIDTPEASAVAITVMRDTTPIGGAHVYFQNADSSVVLATMTDAAGNASAVMQPGGYVTVINPYTPPLFGGGGSEEIDTFAGVKPGDHLHLAQSFTTTAISFTMTVPFDSNPNADTYKAYSPCGQAQLPSAGSGASPSGTMYLYNCGATTNFLIVAIDPAGHAVDYAYVQNVAVADQQPLDLSAQTYTAATTRTYTFNNPGTFSLSYTDWLTDQGVQTYFWANELANGSNADTAMMPAYTGANDLIVANTNGVQDYEYFVDWGPYSSTFTTDIAARALPAFTSNPSFDPATHTLSISEDAAGATPDFSFGSVAALNSTDGRSWLWRIAAPHTTALVYPQLPTDVYDYNVTATTDRHNYELAIGKVPGGYDAVRPFILSFNGEPSPEEIVTGASGSATLETWAALARSAQRSGDTMSHAPRPAAHVLSHRLR